MKSLRSVALAAFMWGVAPVALLGVAAPDAIAQKKPKGPTISPKLSKQIIEAQTKLNAKDFNGALAVLEPLRAAEGRSAYDDFIINEFSASAYVQRATAQTAAKDEAGAQKSWVQAAQSFEATIPSGFVPPEQMAQRVRNIGIIYYQAKDWPNSIKWMNQSLQAAPDNEMSLRLADAYKRSGDTANAMRAMDGLISRAKASGQAPAEDWLTYQLGMKAQAKDNAAMSAILEDLVRYHPKKEYWQASIDIAQRQPKLSDRATLEIYRLSSAVGSLDQPGDIRDAVQVAILSGVPGDAQNFLKKAAQRGISVPNAAQLKAQADTGAAADIKTLPQGEKDARAAKTGQLDVAMGRAYLSYGQLDNAIAAFQRGLKKGGVRDPDEANLGLGVALYQSGKMAEALAAFKTVRASSQFGATARLWGLHVEGQGGAAAAQ